MSNSKKKITFMDILKIIKKRIRLSTIIMLIVTFASSSFAWFIYATKVSGGITAHIESWNIRFSTEDNYIEEYVSFSIPNIVPGMETYTDSIKAYNLGEHQATINYELVSARILGTRFTIDGTTLTSDMLINKLASNYPFKITFNLSNDNLTSSSGVSTFTLQVDWPYESGNDEVDTYWGSESYKYSSNNPDSPSIEITVKISAIQGR